MPFDLLSQPFCWLTFSHWITNSVNCVRASHTNEKQGNAALFASQKPGCLQWFQTQPSSSRASPCTARTERKSSQGKAEVGAFVSISTTRGVMKGIYTLLNPSAPLIWTIGPLLLPLPGCLQIPPPPTFRQIGSLLRSASACL